MGGWGGDRVAFRVGGSIRGGVDRAWVGGSRGDRVAFGVGGSIRDGVGGGGAS